MQITRGAKTTPGPSDWFTGAVWIDMIATIYVTEGVGLIRQPRDLGEHVTDEEYAT